MAPNRIMFIRHAEKPHEPPCENDDGVKYDGEVDEKSLAVRGWQRAGALAHFFSSQPNLKPNAIFASGIGHESKSHRPKDTVTPLAEFINLKINDQHLKGDVAALMKDVLKQQGTVLVSWEHQLIPDLVGQIPGAPNVPSPWPNLRFDIVWVLDAAGANWHFSQIPQMLLAGDSSQPIT